MFSTNKGHLYRKRDFVRTWEFEFLSFCASLVIIWSPVFWGISFKLLQTRKTMNNLQYEKIYHSHTITAILHFHCLSHLPFCIWMKCQSICRILSFIHALPQSRNSDKSTIPPTPCFINSKPIFHFSGLLLCFSFLRVEYCVLVKYLIKNNCTTSIWSQRTKDLLTQNSINSTCQ